MTKHKIIGLFDPPDRMSCGGFPFLALDENTEKYSVHGIRSYTTPPLDHDEVEEWKAQNLFLDLREQEVKVTLPDHPTVFWMGVDYFQKTQELRIPLPGKYHTISLHDCVIQDTLRGCYGISSWDPCIEIAQELMETLFLTFARNLSGLPEQSPVNPTDPLGTLVRLMIYTNPTHEFTQIAKWVFTPPEKVKNRLTFLCMSDNYAPDFPTWESLQDHFQEVLQEYADKAYLVGEEA